MSVRPKQVDGDAPIQHPKTSFHVSPHPLVRHKLAHMRKRPDECPTREFTRLMREIGMLLAYDATLDFSLQHKHIDTERQAGLRVEGVFNQKPVLIPILRTGLVLSDAVNEIISTTYIGHIGIHNNHESSTLEPYMVTIPGSNIPRAHIIVDPVISTGLTALTAISVLNRVGISNHLIRFIALIITKEARSRIEHKCPHGIKFYIADDADTLDGEKAIPGLGSISSRLYRTN